MRIPGLLLLTTLSVLVAPAAAEPSKDPVLAFVLLNQPALKDVAAIRDSLHKLLPEAQLTDVDANEQVVLFTTAGQRVMIALLPAPVPWADLEGPCRAAWMWKLDCEALQKHQAQLICSVVTTDGPRLDRALLLTKVIAALLPLHDAAGVYWGDGGVVVPPANFEALAKDASRELPPLPLWIDFHLDKNEDGTLDLATMGLAPFHVLEIEVVGSRKPPSELMNVVAGIAAIQLWGEVIKDGDTIGPDDQTKIQTRHAKSIWDRPQTVLRVEF